MRKPSGASPQSASKADLTQRDDGKKTLNDHNVLANSDQPVTKPCAPQVLLCRSPQLFQRRKGVETRLRE